MSTPQQPPPGYPVQPAPGGYLPPPQPGQYPQSGYPGYTVPPPGYTPGPPNRVGQPAGDPPPAFVLPPGFLAAQGQPSPQGPAPAPTRRGPGWWRRNWWGLLIMGPLLVAAVGPEIPEAYRDWRSTGPNERMAGGTDGQWVSIGGGRVRLLSLARTPALKTYDGQPFTLPGSAQIWQAVMEVDTPKGAPLTGCDVTAMDARGHIFDSDPQELNGADVDMASCDRPYDGPKTGPFKTVATFVMTSMPEGVRLTVGSEEHRYAWLTAPG